MLKVLLVDDEPFIAQGLSVLIDWESRGYEIVGTVYNGKEALDFLKSNEVDLILADVKMPVMDGITLLKKIRKEGLSEAFFVIVSGYGDFSYAQQAIKYECTDYILKPVQREQLLELLERVQRLYSERVSERTQEEKMKQAYFARYIQSLLLGRGDREAVEYVSRKVDAPEGLRYVCLAVESGEKPVEPQAMRCAQKAVYARCRQYLGDEDGYFVFMDLAGREEWYDVGVLYDVHLAGKANMTEGAFLRALLENVQDGIEITVTAYVGDKVERVEDIYLSFHTAVMALSLQSFDVSEGIRYYAERKTESSGKIISEEIIEELLKAVEENRRERIKEMVEMAFREINGADMEPEMIHINMNYILVRLTHLGLAQDDSVDQNEIVAYIRENSFDATMVRGSRENFETFMLEYADYLSELRKNTPGSVLAKVEKEIRENYHENITLKELSKKYYVNSAYLGQMFRKQYGIPFKEYLNNYRIEKAAEYLLRTDDKIYAVAEQVGYRDLDYFINRFISVKGCTPTSYRKKFRNHT